MIAILKNKLINNPLIFQTIKLSTVSMLANFLGFLIPIYIAYEFGISKETDVFFLSYGVITFIGVIFSGAVRSVSIPFLKEKLTDKVEFSSFVSTVFFYICLYIGISSIAFFIICLIVYNNTQNVIYWYLCLSIPIVFFTILNSFIYGILNSLNQFNQAEFSPFSRAIVIFAFIFLLQKYLGVRAVIVGYVLGEIGKFLHLIWLVRVKNSISILPLVRNYKLIEKFIKQGSFQIVSTALSSASPLVDKIVASFLIVGSVSIIDYGSKLYLIFATVLNAFLVIILSKWSSEFQVKRFNIVKLQQVMKAVFAITSIVFIVVFIFKQLIVNTLYPSIDYANKNYVSLVLVINMAGFVFNSTTQVINRATIVIQATRIMMVSSIFRVIGNVILDIVLVNICGVLGIALASAIIDVCSLFINYTLFKQRLSVYYDEKSA